jgi:transposase
VIPYVQDGFLRRRVMMGRLNQDQGQLFYSFCLADAVPDDHPIREIASVLDLKWVYAELAPHYSRLGRPSVDPVLMLRMLLIGYAGRLSTAVPSALAKCIGSQSGH